MWERFKEKVTNLIYEEVEEKQEEQTPSEKKPPKAKKQDLGRNKDSEEVKARMTFQYPKKETESFRFPVIPDRDGQGAESHRLRTNRSKRRPQPVSEVNQPAFERRRKRRRRPTNRRRNIHTRSIYEQKKLAEELENVPAYERRRMREIRTNTDVTEPQQEKREAFVNVNEIERERISYSKPDELDAVFRKRDKQKQHGEQVIESSHLQQTPDSDQGSTHADYFSENKTRDRFVEEDEPVIIATESDVHETVEERINKTGISTSETNVTEMNNSTCHIQNDDEYFERERPHTERETHTTTVPSAVVHEDNNETAHRVAATTPNQSIDVPYHLLDDIAVEKPNDREWLRQQKQLLQQTLEHFNVDAKIVAITQGPTVTRIEIQPALGVKVSRIRNLVDDIKLNLAARDIRIEAPIPGKHTVGIEIPNEYPQVVHLQEMLESASFNETNSPLTVALGLTIEGEPYFTDINKMPHGLIAGATGSGKSVCINAMILSLLYKSHYEDVKLMMIDPKMVELTQYNGIPHLLTPVITDAKAATIALKWAVDEMERRYELFVEHQVRNIKRYNRKATEEKLPYIVIIIDELADLMLVSPQEVEDYISRIAQKARAAGIHLILATQRPSVDVITGLIKANIPSRIAFAVSSQVDSRTILDANGAEKLLGKGDMLFVENGMNKQLRLQGPFVSDDEIDRVVHYLRSVAEPDYLFEHEELFLQLEHEEEDELFGEVVEFVLAEEKASTSLLQRRFRIGYNRAARLIDSLYDRGIISAQNGSRPRDVLITKAQWEDNIKNH